MNDNLPPLPAPDKQGCEDDPMYGILPVDYFTAEQMQAYARASIALAPQPQPVQEPVAWIEREWSGSGLKHLHFERREPSVRDEVMNPVWTPLYTSPQAQPLSDEQIAALFDPRNGAMQGVDEVARRFARAVEQAHGITKGTT